MPGPTFSFLTVRMPYNNPEASLLELTQLLD